MKHFFEDQLFEYRDFTKENIEKHQYDHCIFKQCNFSKTQLFETDFTDCEFVDCDFSLAKMTQTGLKNVKFKACNFLGVNFSDCKSFLLEMDFMDCQLSMSSFYQLKLKKMNMTPRSPGPNLSMFLTHSLPQKDFFIEGEEINTGDYDYDVRDESYHYLINTKFDNSIILNYRKNYYKKL